MGLWPVKYNVHLFLSSLALLAAAAHGAMASEVGCTPLSELARDHTFYPILGFVVPLKAKH